jgi:peptidoglycan/LPS O-acetylase OafA/YrhL
VIAVAICVAAGISLGVNAYRIASTLLTAATGLAIVASLRVRWWNALLVGPTMQFLGRISYSLYLLHLCVGWRTVVVIREWMGESYSTFHAYAAFAIGMAVSIAAASVMYILIERPSITLARRIRLPQRSAAVPAPG